MTNWHETLKLLDPALIVLLCSMEILIIYIFDRCTVQHCHGWLYHGWLSLYCPLDGHGKLLWTGRQRTAHYKCGWSNAENLTSRTGPTLPWKCWQKYWIGRDIGTVGDLWFVLLIMSMCIVELQIATWIVWQHQTPVWIYAVSVLLIIKGYWQKNLLSRAF